MKYLLEIHRNTPLESLERGLEFCRSTRLIVEP